jgi:hypothetical protein
MSEQVRQIITYDPRKKKHVLVGFLFGDTLVRNVKPEHFMTRCQGYGLQESAYQQLVVLGVRSVILHATATGDEYVSKLADWAGDGINPMDFGNGKQRFLSVNRMKRIPFHKN